jgi:hypothetical protein
VKQQSDPKTYTNRHVVIPVFFNEPEDLTGWIEGKPGVAGRIVAVKSVLYSDGSARRWYRMAAVKKKLKQKKNSTKREKRVSKTCKKN